MPLLEKFLIVLGTLVALMLAGMTSSSAKAESHEISPLCNARNVVLTSLKGNFSEKPTSMGLASNGNVVELLNSNEGSWSIIMTMPNGVSCLMASGNYWQKLKAKTAEQKL